MNAASEPPDCSARPIWAIFDADAVARERWKVSPPYVDPDAYCFSANTLVELAALIKQPYQTKPMDGATPQATVERYNAVVDSGTDVDFGKPMPKACLQTYSNEVVNPAPSGRLSGILKYQIGLGHIYPFGAA
jgi:hypothetical protein